MRLTTRRRTHQAAFAVRLIVRVIVVVVIPGVRAAFSGAVVARRLKDPQGRPQWRMSQGSDDLRFQIYNLNL